MTLPSSPRLHDYLDSSSLDPLATSIGDENADPEAFAQSSPFRLPLSSPSKPIRIIEDFLLTSPHGANKRSLKVPSSSSRNVSYQNLSPWRIRVTVEAEPEEMGTSNCRTTTRMMKVPLRDDSPSTGYVKGRGRRPQARSSAAQRRSTPVRGTRSSSNIRRQSVTDLNITVLGDEEDLNEWSPHKSVKRGRPRSKKTKKEQEQPVVPDDGPDAANGLDMSEGPGFEIRPDSDAEGHATDGGDVEENSPELRKIDLNKVSVRSKSRPSRGHQSRHEKFESNTSLPAILPPTLTLETGAADSRATADAYPTPTSSILDAFDDLQNLPGGPTEQHEGFDTILESEGFTMIDLESIPSARHFVSPPNEREKEKAGHLETPAKKSNTDTSQSRPAPSTNLPPVSSPEGQTQSRSRLTAIPSYLTLPEGESDLSSTIPSSPPVLTQAISASGSNSARPQTRLTPVPYSSPSLPSPPRASAAPFLANTSHSQKSTPPKLARVVRAGIALQGVLSPKVSSETSRARSPRLTKGTPKDRLDDLFEGFDSGTRRELRAGLRLGEELAKRQKSNGQAETEKKITKIASSTQPGTREKLVQHTPIALPTDATEMVEKRSCPTSTISSEGAKRVKGAQSTSQAGLTTPIRARGWAAGTAYPDTRGKEQQWQLEREAVSRQIHNANPSQVIVISSDGVDEDTDDLNTSENLVQYPEDNETDGGNIDETNGDIWPAEVETHNSSQRQTDRPSSDLFSTSERERQMERAREVVNKPRRSLIPSPWKRGEDLDGASTFMTNDDISGLLWKQLSSGVRFGAGVIKRQRQGKSDAFGGGGQSTPPQLGEGIDGTIPQPTSNYRESVAATDDETAEEEALSGNDPSFREAALEQNEQSGDEDEIGNHVEERACEIDDRSESDTEGRGAYEESTSTHDQPSASPQPIRIPVNFNDSTMSAPPLTPVSSAPQPSRPGTPRSALKGSRPSLGLEEANARKVVFSLQSLCVDESGQKSNSRIKSLSPTPPPSTVPGLVDCLQPAPLAPTLSRGIPEPESVPEPETESKSWFGWLFASSKDCTPNDTPPTTLAVVASCTGNAGMDGACDDTKADPGWVATKSSIAVSRQNGPTMKTSLPSFLRPPSYPSDPARDVSVPLTMCGEFTDVHFRTLHIIYRKSLRRSFHAPDAIRPKLQKMVGAKFTCDEGEYGYFAWEADQDAVVVLERFMMEVELGWEGKGRVEWGWSEKQLCGRLFRIIVGEEVRREQSWRRGQKTERKKKEDAVSVMACG